MRIWTRSRGPRRSGERAVAGIHQSGMKQRIVYTVKSNRQLVQDANAGAIGGCRGWDVLAGRAIGGDALAMQVHACMTVRHLPTLISGSAAHARCNCAYRRSQGRGGDRVTGKAAMVCGSEA